MSSVLANLDWPAVEAEATRHFLALLRLDTTNPPGNEALAVEYLQAVLADAGIDGVRVEPQPGRASLVARLEGGGDGLLLSAHLDVVPAEASRWRHPPFAGVVADGWIWGRGAVDMKHMATYALMALLLAKRLRLPLKRDLVAAWVADEEAGCTWGSRWLATHRPELLRASHALNEVGAYSTLVGAQTFYPIQVAQRGFLFVRLTARGTPGHGSMPRADNAVVALARAVDRVARHHWAYRVTPVAAGFFRALAAALGGVQGLLLRQVLSEPLHEVVLQQILPDKDRARAFHAMLHDTVSPTVLAAGQKVNVIPGEAQADLDCRTLPGTDPQAFLAELRSVVGPAVEVAVLGEGRPAVFAHDTPLFAHLAATIAARDPGAKAVPYLVPGFTDALAYGDLGIQTYGFAPVKLPPDVNFANLFHGDDERIPEEGFRWGLRTLLEAALGWVA